MKFFKLLSLVAMVATANVLADNHESLPTNPPAMLELVITSDGSRMPALMYQAQGEGPHPTVILLHGLPGNEKNLDIAQNIRRAGYNVLFFHYRGAWGAEGDYRLTQLDEDVAAATRFVRENANSLQVDTSALTFLGHSMGGFAALLAGSNDSAIQCVGAMAPGNLSGFIDSETNAPVAWFSNYADSLFMLNGFSAESLAEEITSTPARELDSTKFAPGLADKNVLMVAAKQDVVVPLTMFDPMVTAYQQNPDINLEAHRIAGDHSFSSTREELSNIVVDWLNANCR